VPKGSEKYLLVVVFGIVLAAVAILISRIGTSESPDANAGRCPLKNAAVKVGGAAVEPPLKLQPAPNSQSRTINFDVNRDTKLASFTVTAEPALPEKLEGRFGLVADAMVRTGNEKAETVLFAEPKFSELRISGDRKRIGFDVCLDPPDDIAAGSYTGVVTLDGPPGVESTAVTVTANTKNGSLFGIGLAVTAVTAMFLLFYKEATRRRTDAIQRAGTDKTNKAKAEKWGEPTRDAVNFGWFVGTAIALAAMFGVLYALWESNPSWGDAGFVGSVVALIGAGMAAIGAKEIFSSNGG
jgi:hypothetical protein